jgi:leucyl-tRNA synthetase
VPADASNDAVEAAALADERVRTRLAGRNVVKVIIIPGKTVNLVVK